MDRAFLKTEENNSTDQARVVIIFLNQLMQILKMEIMVKIDPNLSEPPPPKYSPSPLNSELHRHSIDDSLDTSKQAGEKRGDGIVYSQVPSTVSKKPPLFRFCQ